MNNDIIKHEISEQASVAANNQAALHSVMVMEQWGNGETYNEERWIERGRQAVRQTMEGMFLLGRALIILKEHTEYRRFSAIVKEEFGIGHSETARLIAATQRFATPQMQKAQAKLMDLGKSKLLELLVEEDVTLIELADGGEANGMTFDDVDRMTVRELRHSLRAARDDTDAARKVSADKDVKINRLTEQLEKQKSTAAQAKPADVAEDLKLQLASMTVGIESQISRYRDLFAALLENAAASGQDHTPVMVGCLNQIIRDCEALREQFVLPQEAPTDARPEWLDAE